MMGFDVDVVVLLLLAFALGGVVAYLLRLRARRRGLEALARATLTAIDPKGAAAEAHFIRAVRPSEPPHGESPHVVPPHGAPPQSEHVPLAPEDPELPLDLPAALPPSLAPQALARGRRARAKEAGRRAEPVPPAHGTAPPLLAAPEGTADDLKRLKGIGPQNERRLNALGIFHVRQIAAWTPEEVRWVGATLAFPGRIEREDWVAQAKALLAGGAGPDGPDPAPHPPASKPGADGDPAA